MTKFIGISGKKGHGKNFFADLLVPLIMEDGLTVSTTSFAAPIKQFCHNVFGIAYDDMDSQQGKLKKTHLKWCDIYYDICYSNNVRARDEKMSDYLTIRELLQIIGTDVWRKRFYDKIWAEAPFHKKWDVDVVLITDVRFPNEVETIKQKGGTLVRVVRPSVTSNDSHISETALDNYKWNQDEVVINEHIRDLVNYYRNVLKGKICV